MPLSSNTLSPSRCSSNASAYWKPEQPPPRTATRSPAVWTSALWAERNSRTFSAPLSVKLTMILQRLDRHATYGALRSVATATLWTMPSAEELKARIEAAIPDSVAEIEDLTGGGDHFRATVTSPAFEGLSRIEQHRRIYAVFGAEVGGP